MKIKISAIFLIIIFFSVFIIFYKGLQSSNIYTPKFEIKKNIPFFKAQTLANKNQVNSKEIFDKNKFYLMNIWASWCLPCIEEHSYLMHLSKQKNIEIIGLNYKDKKKNAQNFLMEFDNPYKVIFLDNDGTIAIDWGAYGVPESFLIHENKIIKKIIGPLNKNSVLEIERLIE